MNAQTAALVSKSRTINTYVPTGSNLEAGIDYSTGYHTLGVLAGYDRTGFAAKLNSATELRSTRAQLVPDSLVQSDNAISGTRSNYHANANYRYDNTSGRSLNLDFDYGHFGTDEEQLQPNRYTTASGQLLREETAILRQPVAIDIYTAKLDYEQPAAGGQLGAGAKFTKVVSGNRLGYYDRIDGEDRLNTGLSNDFTYDEQVEAAYLNYNVDFGPQNAAGSGKTFGLTTGLRLEHTASTGILTAYRSDLDEKPVEFDYFSLFPSVGFTYAAGEKHNLAFNLSRRIDRPYYSDLNPFEFRISALTAQKGNPFLRPVIINAFSLTHTFASRYTTKLTLSRSNDEINRVFRVDPKDQRRQLYTFDNLTTRDVASITVSAPLELRSWWNVYATLTGKYSRNRASLSNDLQIDISRWSYNGYIQNTFTLPRGWSAELSSWFMGPSLQDGNLLISPMGSLDLGVKRKFFGDKLSAQLSLNDLLHTAHWSGTIDSPELNSTISGEWNSQRLRVSLSYTFGNNKIKRRERKTGLGEAAERVGS